MQQLGVLPHRSRKHDEVGHADLIDRRRSALDGAAAERMREDRRSIDPDDPDGWPPLAHRERDRATNQAETGDGDGVKRGLRGRGHRQLPTPTARLPDVTGALRDVGVGDWELGIRKSAYRAQPRLATGSRQIDRPMAGAMIRSSAMSRSNCDGNIDWAPSLSA